MNASKRKILHKRLGDSKIEDINSAPDVTMPLFLYVVGWPCLVLTYTYIGIVLATLINSGNAKFAPSVFLAVMAAWPLTWPLVALSWKRDLDVTPHLRRISW